MNFILIGLSSEKASIKGQIPPLPEGEVIIMAIHKRYYLKHKFLTSLTSVQRENSGDRCSLYCLSYNADLYHCPRDTVWIVFLSIPTIFRNAKYNNIFISRLCQGKATHTVIERSGITKTDEAINII